MDNILVFPCGSEIGLEIRRAFVGVKDVKLIGASSVPDHGRFVFENYREGLPNIDDENFIQALNDLIEEEHVDYIFPAHDSVVLKLASNQSKLNATVIGSCAHTCEVARSKSKTYEALQGLVPVPKMRSEKARGFPFFLKPDVGQGSKGTHLVHNSQEMRLYLEQDPSLLVLEYLPGEEYTIDCFTDFNGTLRFCGPRKRNRILNGISVGTFNVKPDKFLDLAHIINTAISFNGAWFFQVKRAENGELKLMEIAPRIGGSSALYRIRGLNFPLLSYYNAKKMPVNILCNEFNVELSRSWSNKYRLDIQYSHVYMDFDDCLWSKDDGVNTDMVKFIFQCRNKGIKVHLLSRHEGYLLAILMELDLNFFDSTRQLEDNERKSDFIDRPPAIFIDDSFAERQEVYERLSIPVFAPDAIEGLLD